MRNQTYISKSQPWGLFARYGHRVLCSDGVIRACRMASTPDTFFSIPASIKINNKTVSGYVTTREQFNQVVYCFRQHSIHNDKLPNWPEDWSDKFNDLICKAFVK